jgi:glycosyltransferase involved in cell wall biosynthesis
MRASGQHMIESQTAPAALRRSVLVAIPAHNEDRFIGSLVLKLRARDYSVLVVDDGSTDATARVAEAAGATVVAHASNLGKTAAVQTAFEHAQALPVDALVLLDGDSQHDPGDVETLLEPVLDGQADMVVGSRFAGIRSRIPRWRAAGQRALTAATNLGSGLRLSDSESGFRAFSRRAIEEMRFRGSGFAIEPETQFAARQRGWKVLEVPIRVHYELPLKRNPVWHGMRQIDAILRLIAEHRPLLFFGVPGLITLFAGLALGYAVIRIYEATTTLAVGYALITVLLVIVGLLSMFVGIMLHAIRGLLNDAAAEAQAQRRGG